MATKQAKQHLVQTKVPTSLAEWLKAEARREGITVAAYVRRLIMKAEEAAA